ncbi:MAG: helix-hairpin-helix domain-containing protein [Endomicrobiales bacterium]|nr:helix-hairpin-helix domain-containing protein [Endomicrobiales bacterium]
MAFKKRFYGLRAIPGVGPSIARDLVDLGYREVSALRGADPEGMYRKLCSMRGCRIDRCVLYVFRCAVYFAGRKKHDPRLLKWWNWKEENT